MSLKKIIVLISIISLLFLVVACGELDTIFPSSGTYRVDAIINETSLADNSIIKQTDAISPYFINSTVNDPDLLGLEVFLQTREGLTIGRKIRYILAEGKEKTILNETIEPEDQINIFETESAGATSYDKKHGKTGGNESDSLEIAVEGTVFELARLDKDMPAFFLPSDLEIGYYTLVFEVLGKGAILYRTEKPVIFLKDAEFTINDIQSFLPGYREGSHLVPPGTEILLEVEVSASPSLEPYVVWYSAQNRIGESFVSGGKSRIMWTTPSRTGFQTIRAEVFPFKPDSGIKGLSRELSVPISAKNGGIGYFTKEADSLTHWFQFEGNLYDTKAPLDNHKALTPQGNILPRWLTDMGIYGLAIGPEDAFTLAPVSFFKVGHREKGKGVFMLYFKPKKEGILFTTEFKSDNGENVRLILSIENRVLKLALSTRGEARSTSFNLDWREPESFIPVAINFTIRANFIMASLSMKDLGINTEALNIPLSGPLNGEALLSFGAQPDIKNTDIQPPVLPVISGDGNPMLLSPEQEEGSGFLDPEKTAIEQTYTGTSRAEDTAIAILDEFAVSFTAELFSADEQERSPENDSSREFTNSVQRTQGTAHKLQTPSSGQIEVITDDKGGPFESIPPIKLNDSSAIPSKSIGGGGGGELRSNRMQNRRMILKKLLWILSASQIGKRVRKIFMQYVKFSMKKLFAHLMWFGVLFCNACAAKQAKLPVVESGFLQEPTRIRFYRIVQYKDKDEGAEIPVWASRYLDEDTSSVEALNEYNGKYIFIAENTGINFRTLQQWAAAFSIDQDFPRKVASRIEKRLLKTAVQYPDDEYGDFFEESVKAASNAHYTGAVREGDFWLLQQYFEEDGITVSQELYTFLVLISIDKSHMENQILLIFNNLELEHKLTKEQASTVSRIKGDFFENF
jgi:hypothetical protein